MKIKSGSMKKLLSRLLPLIIFLHASQLMAQEGGNSNTRQPGKAVTAGQERMVRIAEIEIEPAYLQEYLSILKEEAAASVKLEPGVIAIFPMYQKENPTQVRILESYANKAAYQSHLQTPHFIHYKTATLKMVKHLKLVEMECLDKDTMVELFKKME